MNIDKLLTEAALRDTVRFLDIGRELAEMQEDHRTMMELAKKHEVPTGKAHNHIAERAVALETQIRKWIEQLKFSTTPHIAQRNSPLQARYRIILLIEPIVDDTK